MSIEPKEMTAEREAELCESCAAHDAEKDARIAMLVDELKRFAIVRQVAGIPNLDYCAECRNLLTDGHADDCKVALALTATANIARAYTERVRAEATAKERDKWRGLTLYLNDPACPLLEFDAGNGQYKGAVNLRHIAEISGPVVRTSILAWLDAIRAGEG